MGNCQNIDQHNILIPRQGNVKEIIIKNTVWSKQYQGLFDYDSENVNIKKFVVEGNATVVKNNGKYILVNEKDTRNIENSKNSLFKLIRNDNFYFLSPISFTEKDQFFQKPVWLVIKSLPKQCYSIKQRDVIKFGKQKLKVREVVPEDNNPSTIVNNDNIRLSKITYENLDYDPKLKLQELNNKMEKEIGKEKALQNSKNITQFLQQYEEVATQQCQNENTCRICLEPGLTTNPLINPCKCIGSVRFIHLLCLKAWLSKQIKATITDHSVSLLWKPLCCEMCRAKYKYRIYLDNQKYYTVDIPKPEKPYLVVEVADKKRQAEGKLFKFISFKNKPEVELGRKKDIDVRISDDISVSRTHAIMKYNHQSKEFILLDNKSKFGSLVLVKNGLLLRPHHAGITLQIGAEIFEFSALRESTELRSENYEMGQEYLAEDVSELQDEEEEDVGNESEDNDEVLSLPENNEDRSPAVRKTTLRRGQSMETEI